VSFCWSLGLNLGDEYDQIGVNERRDVTLALAALAFYLCTFRFFCLGYIIFRSRHLDVLGFIPFRRSFGNQYKMGNQ
jgi:D-alanyl-lipoteichoic acid acyltransferase DltB (MBOAT superfamily)